MTVEEKQGDKNGEYRKMETENKDVRPEKENKDIRPENIVLDGEGK